MLTRLRFRRDLKLFVRCLSDVPPENNDKKPEGKAKPEATKKDTSDAATQRIQELLKLMMTEPKISEKEYSENFVTASEPRRKKADEIEVKSEKIEESLTKAAEEVAQAIGGDVKQTEAELLSKVLGKINQTSTSLSDLITGMKVDRSRESDDVLQKETRGQQVKRFVNKSQTESHKTRYVQRKTHADGSRDKQKIHIQQPLTVNVFSGNPLGIFTMKEPNYGTQLDVWNTLKQREVELATSQPPANYFQKMILWTEQGKVWKFPINNEQGMEEEENVHFSEHIFLDSQLEDWCPKRGPVRHFMELVCVGLSKNAFYTVKEKREHIQWYKEYFESKKDVLNEVGAWNVDTPPSTEASA